MPDLRKSQLARKNIFWFIAPRPPKNLNFLLSHRRRRICGGVRKVENARVRRMRKYSFNNWSFSLFFTGFFFFYNFLSSLFLHRRTRIRKWVFVRYDAGHQNRGLVSAAGPSCATVTLVHGFVSTRKTYCSFGTIIYIYCLLYK